MALEGLVLEIIEVKVEKIPKIAENAKIGLYLSQRLLHQSVSPLGTVPNFFRAIDWPKKILKKISKKFFLLGGFEKKILKIFWIAPITEINNPLTVRKTVAYEER